MESIKTIFGGKKLLYNGYIYIKDRDTAEATYWRCEKRGTCNGRMTTLRINESVKNHPSSHNHPPDVSSDVLLLQSLTNVLKVYRFLLQSNFLQRLLCQKLYEGKGKQQNQNSSVLFTQLGDKSFYY